MGAVESSIIEAMPDTCQMNGSLPKRWKQSRRGDGCWPSGEGFECSPLDSEVLTCVLSWADCSGSADASIGAAASGGSGGPVNASFFDGPGAALRRWHSTDSQSAGPPVIEHRSFSDEVHALSFRAPTMDHSWAQRAQNPAGDSMSGSGFVSGAGSSPADEGRTGDSIGGGGANSAALGNTEAAASAWKWRLSRGVEVVLDSELVTLQLDMELSCLEVRQLVSGEEAPALAGSQCDAPLTDALLYPLGELRACEERPAPPHEPLAERLDDGRTPRAEGYELVVTFADWESLVIRFDCEEQRAGFRTALAELAAECASASVMSGPRAT